MRIADEVGSQFSGFDLDKTLGVRMTTDIIPNLPNESANRIFPIVIGEHSDIGALDENGDAADKGLLPFIDAGWVSIGADGTVLFDGAALPRLSAPENFTGSVTGTAGSRTRNYVVTALSEVGETTPSVTLSATLPDTLGDDGYVDLSWDAVDGAVAYNVYANGRRMETLDADTTTFRDDGSSAATGPTVPLTNTAYIDEDINGVTYQVHRMFIAKINAASEILFVYGSDLASGETPKRIRLPESVYPDQVKVYGRPGYPHDDPYVELNGVRFAPMYARGPLVDHHLRGIVTFTWNGCGDEEIGDGSGDTITEAFRQLEHVLNEYVLRDGGLGYRTGDFSVALETYSNGVAKLRSSAFEDAQDLTVEWVGDRGYQGAFALVTPISLREFLRRFAVTFGCYYATNHFGQFYPFLVDDSPDPDAGRHYRDRIEVIRMVSQELLHDQVETKVVYHFDFDTDAQEFRFTDQVLEDEAATEAHGGVPRQRDVRQCFYTRDALTARDANSRYLTRYKTAPRLVGIEVAYDPGLEDENGDPFRLTHYDGLGEDGDVNTPMIVMRHVTNPDDPNTVVLVGWDLQRLADWMFPLLADEDLMTDGNLGDETSAEPPPIGACELR
jgi:hypothetical protein